MTSHIEENKFYYATAKNYKATWFVKSIVGDVIEIYNITNNTTMRKTHFELMLYFSLMAADLQKLD